MKTSLITLFLSLLLGCAGSGKKKAENLTPSIEPTLQADFDRGIAAMDRQNFGEAARIFRSILVQKPATELDLVVQFNLGVALEEMGECKQASDRYRQVVRSSATKFKRIEAEALFRLSLAYECMGQDAKTITALLDAQRRGKSLAYESVQAEIPARLAAAYSRLGNRAKATEYFNQASNGLKSIVARGGTQVQRDLVARTMFVMGRLNTSQKNGDVDPQAFLLSLSVQQPYLLQAMEMKNPIWSPRAESDLRLAYENVWRFRIEGSENQHRFYTRGLQVINELRKIRMPKPDPQIDGLFALLDDTESRLQKELIKVAETNRLTPDAEKREGLRREGRLVDPKPKKPKDSTAR
jgi:tetratricopeptide (TPR) repeat protein